MHNHIKAINNNNNNVLPWSPWLQLAQDVLYLSRHKLDSNIKLNCILCNSLLNPQSANRDLKEQKD